MSLRERLRTIKNNTDFGGTFRNFGSNSEGAGVEISDATLLKALKDVDLFAESFITEDDGKKSQSKKKNYNVYPQTKGKSIQKESKARDNDREIVE